MRRISIALAAGAVMLSASAAFAADISVPRRPPVAPIVPPPQFVTWTGCYVGGFIGGAWRGHVNATEPADANGNFYNDTGEPYIYPLDHSWIAGGTLGCNYQIGVFVFGVEGEASYLRLEGSAVDPNSVLGAGSDTIDSTKVGDWYGVIAARAGVAFGPAFFYAKGGAVFFNVSSTIIDNCVILPCSPSTLNAAGSSDDLTWAVGGGIEYALDPFWSIKVEYLHLGHYRDYAVCGPGGGDVAGITFCSTHQLDGIHTAKLGVNFRFGL